MKNFLLIVYLFVLSIFDTKEKSVPTILLVIGVITASVIGIYELLAGKLEIWNLLFSFIPGSFMAAVALFTKKAGLADGIVLIIVGILTGYQQCIFLFSFSLLLLSVFCIFFLLFRKGNKNSYIPYLPFLFFVFFLSTLSNGL